MSDPVTEAVGRLEALAAGDGPANGQRSTDDVGRLMQRIRVADLRTVLLALSTAQRERDEAREVGGALLQWFDLLSEELDVDPDETFIRFNAVGPEGERELAKVSLTDTLTRARKALEQAP